MGHQLRRQSPSSIAIACDRLWHRPPGSRGLRISGVFRAGDTDTFVRSLEVSLSVRAINRDGSLVLVPSDQRAGAGN